MQTAAQPANLANIIRQNPTPLGFCNTSVIGVGGVWLHPSRSGSSIVWHQPWPPDMIAEWVSDTKQGGVPTSSDLELASLVLHKATLL